MEPTCILPLVSRLSSFPAIHLESWLVQEAAAYYVEVLPPEVDIVNGFVSLSTWR
jgi:hypothetical protein